MNKIEKFIKFGSLLIGILSFQIGFSQENYIPGYVIRNNSDTLFGLVDYRDWANNPDKISFKTSIENNTVSFTPTDIIEFRVGAEIYVSGIINTEVSQVQTSKLDDDDQLNIKVDTTFLQTLFRGEKNLFYYKNSTGRENFYIQQDKGFELLIYKRYLIHQDGRHRSAENITYLGQLSLYLSDCKTINSRLTNTLYKQNSLIKLFQYYYKCSSSDISFQKDVDKVRVEKGIMAGVSLTSLKFRSESLEYLAEANYSLSINFSTGLYLDLILPRNHGKWSINNEILLSTYKVKGRYEDYQHENFYSTTTTEIGYSYLKINNLGRYKYPIGRLFLFLNAGISNGFAFNETNYKRKESKFYSTERVVEELALNDTRKLEHGIILGTGIKYNRLSMELRFEIGNGMTQLHDLNAITKRFYFLLGYRF